MWTFGFFLSLVRNTGPVDGSFAQLHYWGFFHFLLDLLWQQEPDLPYTQVLLSGLSVAASFCSVPRPLQSVFTWGKNPAPPHSCSIHTPNLCNTFYLGRETLVASHTCSGTKEWVHHKKLDKPSRTRLQGRGKGPERGGGGASAEAESSVLPSIVPRSQWLLPSCSSSWPVCSSCGSALADHPQAFTPSCFQHCQWSWWAQRCCPQCFIPILVVALWWRTGTGKRTLL